MGPNALWPTRLTLYAPPWSPDLLTLLWPGFPAPLRINYSAHDWFPFVILGDHPVSRTPPVGQPTRMQQAAGVGTERSQWILGDKTQLVPTILLPLRRRVAWDLVTDQGPHCSTATSQEVLREYRQGVYRLSHDIVVTNFFYNFYKNAYFTFFSNFFLFKTLNSQCVNDVSLEYLYTTIEKSKWWKSSGFCI